MENNKPVFYMLVGLPASGKSSESDRLGDVIVRSSDYLRDKLCGDINDMKNNGAVFTILQSLVRADLYHSRQLQIISILKEAKCTNTAELQEELGVSRRTLRTDIAYLKRVYPDKLITHRGRYTGGLEWVE